MRCEIETLWYGANTGAVQTPKMALTATTSPQSLSPGWPPSLHRELMRMRTVLVFGEVTAELARATVGQLLALSATGDDPIIVIVSQGGHVEAGDTIFDTIRFIRPQVKMVASGWVASAGALIYCAAPRERRFALPNTRFLLHQPSGGMQGNTAEIEVEVAQIVRMRKRLEGLFAEATGHSVDRIARDTERNHWMNSEEAREYGLVGQIIEHAEDLGER